MPKTYFINTNVTNNREAEVDMIQQQKCAAYYSPWKYYIDEIEANDMIFLYSSGKGIIARGIATGITEINDYEGNSDEEHYMHLDRFQIFRRPLEAAKITELVGHKIQYNQTIIPLAHKFGLEVWQHVSRYCL